MLHLIYGRGDLFGNFDLAGADVIFQGIDPHDLSGASVSSAGDVNGDGLDDILIGAYSADPGGRDRAGETYLVYGRSQEVNIIPEPPTFVLLLLAAAAVWCANYFRRARQNPG